MHILKKINRISKNHDLSFRKKEILFSVSKFAYPTRREAKIKEKLEEWGISLKKSEKQLLKKKKS